MVPFVIEVAVNAVALWIATVLIDGVELGGRGQAAAVRKPRSATSAS